MNNDTLNSPPEELDSHIETLNRIIQQELPYLIKVEKYEDAEKIETHLIEHYGTRMYNEYVPFELLNEEACWDGDVDDHIDYFRVRTPEIAMEIKLRFL